MKRLSEHMLSLRDNGRKALIAYLMGGWPDLGTFGSLVEAVAAAGADAIEVGLPFSDPAADGPVIEAAGQEVLNRHWGAENILTALPENLPIPVILMTYLNPILAAGPGGFWDRAAEARVQGLIVPDLPLEERHRLQSLADDRDIALVGLVAPNTPPRRAAAIAQASEGFVYLVSIKGVTGARPGQTPDLTDLAARTAPHAAVPLCAGFGIAEARQARTAARSVDGVIVGSALIQELAAANDDKPEHAYNFIHHLRRALDEPFEIVCAASKGAQQ